MKSAPERPGGSRTGRSGSRLRFERHDVCIRGGALGPGAQTRRPPALPSADKKRSSTRACRRASFQQAPAHPARLLRSILFARPNRLAYTRPRETPAVREVGRGRWCGPVDTDSARASGRGCRPGKRFRRVSLLSPPARRTPLFREAGCRRRSGARHGCGPGRGPIWKPRVVGVSDGDSERQSQAQKSSRVARRRECAGFRAGSRPTRRTAAAPLCVTRRPGRVTAGRLAQFLTRGPDKGPTGGQPNGPTDRVREFHQA